MPLEVSSSLQHCSVSHSFSVVSVSFSKLIITQICVFPAVPSVLFFCEISLHRVQGRKRKKKRPFRHRLHSAAGPQAPAELTVAIATTMDNYPAKDRYSSQSEQHLVFMLKICCPLYCRVTFTFIYLFFIWGEF